MLIILVATAVCFCTDRGVVCNRGKLVTILESVKHFSQFREWIVFTNIMLQKGNLTLIHFSRNYYFHPL